MRTQKTLFWSRLVVCGLLGMSAAQGPGTAQSIPPPATGGTSNGTTASTASTGTSPTSATTTASMNKNYALQLIGAANSFASALSDARLNPSGEQERLASSSLLQTATLQDHLAVSAIQRLLKPLKDPNFESRRLYPLEEALKPYVFAGVQGRWGRDFSLYAPELAVSDPGGGFDLGIQGLFGAATRIGNFEGFGVALQVELDPVQMDIRRLADNARITARAFRQIVEYAKRAAKSPGALIGEDLRGLFTKEEIVRAGQALTAMDTQAKALKSLFPANQMQLRRTLRASFLAGYQRLGRIGGYGYFGVNASLFVPRAKFQVVGSALWHDFDPQPGLPAPRAASGRLGVALIWRDVVPFITKEGKVRSWRWQAGGEYIGENATDRGDSFSLFLRYRPHRDRSYDDRSPMWEITGIYGQRPDGESYGGVNIGVTFD